MKEQNDHLRERLIDLDPHVPGLRERYGSALHSELDRLTVPYKVRYLVTGLAGLIGSLVCGSLAITEPASLPARVRMLLVLFAFFGLSWTLLAGWALARGRGDFIAQRTMAARMAFGFTLISVLALSLVSSLSGKSAVGMPMVATGLALLVLAAVLLIDARIERSESIIREQLLRVESRLTGLAEAIAQPRGSRNAEG
ncbi:MAG: hypothetical protein WKF75_07230 [Singulisphaera sp.]